MLRYCGFPCGIANLAGHGVVVKVVTCDPTGARVRAEGGGWEKVLPTPLAAGVWPFAQQGFRHVDVTRADCEILEMLFAEASQMFREPLLQGDWQSDDAVFSILSIMDGDGSLAEIQILDAQAHGFHEPEAAAIHDLGDQFPWIFQTGENRADFLAGHDDRRAALTTGGSDVVESEFLASEDVFHEKSHGVERLLLGGRGDVSFQREEVEVGGDGGGPGGLRGLAEFLVAEADEPAVPVDVSLLGSHRLVLDPDDAAERINEPLEFRFGIGDLFRSRRGRRGQIGPYADCFTGKSPVVRLQGAGLIRQASPIEGGCPWDGEDIASQNAGGIDGLAELPIGQMGGPAEGIEIGLGAFGGSVAAGFGPCFGPAGVIFVGGGPDRRCCKDLQELLANW